MPSISKTKQAPKLPALSMSSTIEEIDVLKEPLRALSDKVLLTPTLVMLRPEPQRRLLGSLNEREKVLNFLGI